MAIVPCPNCSVFTGVQCDMHRHLAGDDMYKGVAGDHRSLRQYIREVPCTEAEVLAAFTAFRGVG